MCAVNEELFYNALWPHPDEPMVVIIKNDNILSNECATDSKEFGKKLKTKTWLLHGLYMREISGTDTANMWK